MHIIKRSRYLLGHSPMKRELRAIIIGSAIVSAAFFAVNLILCGFEADMLLGLVTGWIFLIICELFLAWEICRCAELKISQIRKGKRIIRSCYFLRFFGLFLLCWLGFESNAYNPVGILIPQFTPRIIVTFIHFFKKGSDKLDGRTEGRVHNSDTGRD